MTSPRMTTCLGEEPHDANIKDVLLHFLGCVEYSERDRFLNDDNYILWENESRRLMKLGLDPDTSRKLSRKKRVECAEECRTAVQRVVFLREQLRSDPIQEHYVKSIENSAQSWKTSRDFEENIEHVRAWRASQGKALGKIPDYQSQVVSADAPYELERDVQVSLMRFEDSKPLDYIHEDVSASFPHQLCTFKSLVHGATKGENDVLKRDSYLGSIRYFHIPSNNMLVSY